MAGFCLDMLLMSCAHSVGTVKDARSEARREEIEERKRRARLQKVWEKQNKRLGEQERVRILG